MEINKSYYAIIPANVRYDKRLKDKAKLLYGEITALCNEKGYCWATNRYFAELYSVSTKTISILIKNLIDSGYIYSEIIYKEGTKEIDKRYLKITNTPIEEKVNTYIQNGKNPMEEKVNTPMEEKVKENNTIINNTINNKKNKKKSEIDELIESYTDNKELINTIYEFIKMRKSIKSPMTTKAVQLMLNRLSKFSNKDNMKIDILNQSILNSWKGIFELKKGYSNNAQHNNAKLETNAVRSSAYDEFKFD